jgi:hypothetical protein
MPMSEIESEVWNAVQDMNRAWTAEGNADRLISYFHPRMVAVTPNDRERIEGQAACVKGWWTFTQLAQIHAWKVHDPRVELFCNDTCAVVTYYYEMDCTFQGVRMTLAGRDMLTLVKENVSWWLVADQFSPYPKQ